MPDKWTQFNSLHENYFMALFDDIFSTFEEELTPIETIKNYKNIEDRKQQRRATAEAIKMSMLKKSMPGFRSELAGIEEKHDIIMAREVSQEIDITKKLSSEEDQVVKLMKELKIDQQTARAYFPLDVHIHNVNLEQHMQQWGLGGPTCYQYNFVAHLISLSKADAELWFLNIVAAYTAFRENLESSGLDREDHMEILKDKMYSKREENFMVNLFSNKDLQEIPTNGDNHVPGPSLGKAFLKLGFLTNHNQAFKTFVAKTMNLDPELRVRLVSRYLFNLMTKLMAEYYRTKELKYNYLRMAWDRKFHFMDDYTVCLIMFINDKTANITWDEVDEILWPEVREIHRSCYKIAFETPKQ